MPRDARATSPNSWRVDAGGGSSRKASMPAASCFRNTSTYIGVRLAGLSLGQGLESLLLKAFVISAAQYLETTS
jgi:hypothetical protein